MDENKEGRIQEFLENRRKRKLTLKTIVTSVVTMMGLLFLFGCYVLYGSEPSITLTGLGILFMTSTFCLFVLGIISLNKIDKVGKVVGDSIELQDDHFDETIKLRNDILNAIGKIKVDND